MEHLGEQLLHKKDSKLHTSVPVEHEMQRQKNIERRKNGKDRQVVSQKPDDKIANWLEVIERTHLNHDNDPRVLERIKQYYRNEYVIKSEDVPESAFLLEQKIARQLGHGTIKITDDFKQKKTEQIIGDQTQSLDKWINYLSSPDAKYPIWAKYWAFKALLTMGKFEKQENEITHSESGQFQKRTKNTVANFPPLNPRALAMAIGAMIEKTEKKEIASVSKKLSQEQFNQLLATENFSKIYAQFLIEMPEYSTEGLKETRGKWVIYKQGDESAPDRLVKSLEGYPLEWCTANIETAKDQLQGGNFYIYYSINPAGEAVIPRLAIRMEEDKIAEIRGIAIEQNLDPYIGDVVDEKLKQFPDGKLYKKKVDDMKRLTKIEEKSKSGQELDKDELIFLYEFDSKINGFGYAKDPRIREIRKNRDKKSDISLVTGYKKEEISTTKEEAFSILIDGTLGGNIKFHYGDISLYIKSIQEFQKNESDEIKRIKFPEIVSGSVYLKNLKSSKNITLPRVIKESLFIDDLESIEGLKLPEVIGSSISNFYLESVNGLEFPKTLFSLHLHRVKSLKGVKLPAISDNLKVPNLVSTEGLELSEIIPREIILGYNTEKDEELYNKYKCNITYHH